MLLQYIAKKPPPMKILTRSIDVTAIDVNIKTDVNSNNNSYTNKNDNTGGAVVTSTSPAPGTPLIAAAVRAVEAVGQGSKKLQSTLKKEMDNDVKADKQRGDVNDNAFQRPAQQERNNNGRESAVIMRSDNDTEYKQNDSLQAAEVKDGRTMSIKV